jgi:hypothetical protein
MVEHAGLDELLMTVLLRNTTSEARTHAARAVCVRLIMPSCHTML